MIGVLIYCEKDYWKNKSYANWLIVESEKLGLTLKILFAENFYKNGIIEKYDFVINRSRDFNISLCFELNGVKTFNNSEISMLGNNKLYAYKYAFNNGFSFCEIFLNISKEKNFITKPIDGHGGKNIELSNFKVDDKNFFAQKFLQNIVGDIRFYIINNKIISAVIRKNENNFIYNYSNGGNFQQYFFSKEEECFVLKFIKNLKIDFCGVDFFLTKNNQLIFNEIEDAVGSRMLSELNINNTTELFLQHIEKNIKL